MAAEVPVFDASPWGLGGVLYNDADEVLVHFSSPVTEADDCAALGIRVDVAAQATLETLASRVGLRLWETRFRGRRLQLPLKSDSTAALALAGKLASASPALNHLGAEISLQCESWAWTSGHPRTAQTGSAPSRTPFAGSMFCRRNHSQRSAAAPCALKHRGGQTPGIGCRLGRHLQVLRHAGGRRRGHPQPRRLTLAAQGGGIRAALLQACLGCPPP